MPCFATRCRCPVWPYTQLDRVSGDKCIHQSGELFAFVFLQEVATTGNEGVCLPLGSRYFLLESFVSTPRDGVTIGESGEQWFVPCSQHFPCLCVGNVQIENYVVTPRIMKRTLEVPGAVTIIAALIGSSLLGLIGGLLAVPVAAAIILILDEVVYPRADNS